jgi:predicted double-glycine peptidase
VRRHYDFSRGQRAKYARRLRRNPIHAVDFKLAAAMRGLRQAIASESRHDPSPDQVEAMVDTAFDFAKTNWQKTGRRILPVSEYPKLRLLAVQRLTELVRGGELRRNPGILSGDGGRTAKPVRGDRLKTLDDAAWVAPDGDIYMVRRDHEDPDFVNHGKWAGYFFGKSERALEEAGWIKLQYGHWQAHPRTRPTDAQQQAMADRDAACGVKRNEDLFADNPGVTRPLPAAARQGRFKVVGRRNPGFVYEVRGETPNMESIAATLTNYKVRRGVVRIPISEFDASFRANFYAADDHARVKSLAEKIQASGWVSPLIVVKDAEGYYVLEGAHRLVALGQLGAADIPATVVDDMESWRNPSIRPLPLAAAKGMKVLKGFRPAKQATAYTCGPACARAVLAYKGFAGVTEAQLAREAGTTKRHGTTPTRLCQTLADNGARIVPTKRACLAWCLRQLRQSRPVLLLWNDWKGHWVVLIGYDARRKLLLLADPAAATGVAVHAYDTFKRNWRTRVKGQVYRRLAIAIA